MKSKIIALLLVLLCTYSACKGQQQESRQFVRKERFSGSDNKGSWKVSRSLDKEGNILFYDSSYLSKNAGTPIAGSINVPDSLPDYFSRKINDAYWSFFDRSLGKRFIDSLYTNSFSYHFFSHPKDEVKLPDFQQKRNAMEAEIKKLREKVEKALDDPGSNTIKQDAIKEHLIDL